MVHGEIRNVKGGGLHYVPYWCFYSATGEAPSLGSSRQV